MNQVTAEQLAALAKEHFASNPTVDTYFFTKDGMFFEDRILGASHSQAIKSELATVRRIDVEEVDENLSVFNGLIEEAKSCIADGDEETALYFYNEAADYSKDPSNDEVLNAILEAYKALVEKKRIAKELEAEEEKNRVAAEQRKEEEEKSRIAAKALAKEKADADAKALANAQSKEVADSFSKQLIDIVGSFSPTAEPFSTPVAEPVAAPVGQVIVVKTPKKAAKPTKK